MRVSSYELLVVTYFLLPSSSACNFCQVSSRAVLSKPENGLGENFDGPVELFEGRGTGESGSSMGRAEL